MASTTTLSPMAVLSAYRHYTFGAIGEEIKAARRECVFDDDCDGGVPLVSPSMSSEGTESLRDLVETSEPLIDESPRAARLLSASKNKLCFEDHPQCGSPETTHSHHSDFSRFTTTVLVSPTPQRHFSIDHLQSPTRGMSVADSIDTVLHETLQQSPKIVQPRARSDTVFSTISTTSSAGSGFDQKSYKELFNNINDKIDLVVRKYVYIDPSVPNGLEEVESFLDLAGRHVNYRKVAVLISQTSHLQPALVHGMIWRLINDVIFDTPVLDQAPSPYAQAFLRAWNRDVKCCTIQADDWSIKGPLMEARINAARRVFENTPRFNDWIKSFSAAKTKAIVNKLTIAWPQNTAHLVCADLTEPITKLVRIALRMRCEKKAFDFKFYEYATKASSDHMVLYSEFRHMPPPEPSQDELYHVVCTKIPQVFEKDYCPQTKSKTCIYKAEVVAREKYPGFNENLGDRYRRSAARKSARSYRPAYAG